MEVKAGATRTVILTKRYAFKLPRFYRKGQAFEWSRFLMGLLANLQERYWSRLGFEKLCPVYFADPVGLLIVMPRCVPAPPLDPHFQISSRVLCPVAFNGWRREYLGGSCDLPVENVAANFGYLGGRLVSFDYGS